MATRRKQLDEYCSEVRSDWCCRHKVMYGNSKNVIGMSQSAILHPLVAERELSRTLNPAVIIPYLLPINRDGVTLDFDTRTQTRVVLVHAL